MRTARAARLNMPLVRPPPTAGGGKITKTHAHLHGRDQRQNRLRVDGADDGAWSSSPPAAPRLPARSRGDGSGGAGAPAGAAWRGGVARDAGAASPRRPPRGTAPRRGLEVRRERAATPASSSIVPRRAARRDERRDRRRRGVHERGLRRGKASFSTRSILLADHELGRGSIEERPPAGRGRRPAPHQFAASTTKTTTCDPRPHCALAGRPPLDDVGGVAQPAVSNKMHGNPPSGSDTSSTSRVVPGTSEMMAASRCARAFSRLLFPALGAPASTRRARPRGWPRPLRSAPGAARPERVEPRIHLVLAFDLSSAASRLPHHLQSPPVPRRGPDSPGRTTPALVSFSSAPPAGPAPGAAAPAPSP